MAHYYNKQGVSKYDAKPKEAKEKEYLPSITTIQKIEANIGLSKYYVNQAIEAALTLPMIEGETGDQYIQRVKIDAKQHARNAAKLGSVVHHLAERYIKCKPLFYTGHRKDVWIIFNGLKEWIDSKACFIELEDEEWKAEKVFVNHQEKYAGKADLVIYHTDDTFSIIDFKSQAVKKPLQYKKNPDKLCKPKINYYDSWIGQLVALAECDDLRYKKLNSLLSVVVSTHPNNLGAVYVKEWDLGDIEYNKAKRRFLAQRQLYKEVNGL